MKPKLFQKITSWLELCTPLQTIQQALREYFILSGGQFAVGAQYDISNNLSSLRHYPNTLVIDCTGYHSVLRNHIQPDNLIGRFVEYVLICTFTFDDRYECNELCKYYKNKNTKKFRVIPSIDDTYKTGKRETHVTCLITIDETIFRQVPKREPITYAYLKKHQHEIYEDLNIFLNNLSSEQMRKIHFDTMEFIALPLQLYRARKMTHSVNDNDLNQHWVLLGDAAMGGPYFQSISMGFEAAIYLAYIFEHMKGNVEEMMSKYEYYMEKLWLAIQIRSQEIQRNKQILQLMCADDRNAILEKIKVY
jgi:2-polyprenyl-6-methoxyphenol hydroxylase-like FAD-dependent oxidoreductase